MNLQALSYLAQIVSAATVVIAVVFGILQVRQARQQRRDIASVELMRSIQDAEFTRSLRLIGPLPPGTAAHELRRRGDAHEDAALALGTKYETLGYLVFRGTIPLELVEELVGGVGIALWHRLEDWVRAIRAEQGQPLFMEWFEWLVLQFEARGRSRQVPAFQRFAHGHPAAPRPAAFTPRTGDAAPRADGA